MACVDKFLALRVRHLGNMGAYIGAVGANIQTVNMTRCLPGMYDIRLIDLQARWRAEAQGARNVVAREQASVLLEARVGAPPERVWNAMTDPAHGMRWRVGVDDIREQNPAGGRGVGTVTHCVHGRMTIEQEIVDWLPPHHYTFRERSPMGPCEWTISLAPLERGAATTSSGGSPCAAAVDRRCWCA